LTILQIEGKDIELFAVALAVRDFDAETRTEWSKHLGSDDELPTLEKFLAFITPLSRNLPKKSKYNAPYKGQQKQQQQHHNNNSSKSATASTEGKQEVTSPTPLKKPCPICKEEKPHLTYRCKNFKEATVAQRLQWVKQFKLCPNCLHNSHSQVADCTSTYKCRHCHETHNYLLHQDKPNTSGTSLTMVTEHSTAKVMSGSFIHTALVTLRNSNNRITARAALDSCSSHSILSEAMASFLELQREPLDITISGAVSQQQLNHCATVSVSTVHLSAIDIPIYRSGNISKAAYSHTY